MNNTPGIRWIIILGIAGFAAGFIGPMIFSPDANQGPMVGIFISGPASFALGAALYGICSLLKVSAQLQWRLLTVVTTVAVLTTLLFVQPAPGLEGTLLEAEITSCSLPIDVEADTLKYWEQRVAKVTWATPREGWQRDMHKALQDAPGVMLQLNVTRENSVYKNRKPWNRGSLFAGGWKDTDEKKSFYRPDGSCEQYPIGGRVKFFQRYELNGRIEAPTAWPPIDLQEFIDAAIISEMPESMKTFQ